MSDDETTFLRRQGFWLRAARERSGKSQKGAAEHLGLSGNSKSSVSDYENGVTPASQIYLRRLARWYQVPVVLFTDPAPTPEERIAELAQLATDEERRGWESAQPQGRAAEGARASGTRRRSA